MKLLDQVRLKLRAGHYAYRTEQTYVHWIQRFIRWHAKNLGQWRHPNEMGADQHGRVLHHNDTTNTTLRPTNHQEHEGHQGTRRWRLRSTSFVLRRVPSWFFYCG